MDPAWFAWAASQIVIDEGATLAAGLTVEELEAFKERLVQQARDVGGRERVRDHEVGTPV